MKKYLIFLTIFFSSFLFIKNVNAASDITYNYDSDLVQNYYFNTTADTQNRLNQIIEYLNNNITDYNYIITLKGSYDEDKTKTLNAINVYFFEKDTNCNYYLSNYGRSGYSGDLFLFKTNQNNNENLNVISNLTSFKRYNIIINRSDTLEDKIFTITNDNLNDLLTSESKTLTLVQYFGDGLSINTIYENNYNYNLYYYSNLELKLKAYQSIDYFRNININYLENTYFYTINDIFPSYYNLVNYKKSYTYENLINCKGVSKIRINFKPTNEDLKINFESQFSEHLLGFPKLEYQGDTTFSYNFSDYIGDKFLLGAEDAYGNELYSYNGYYEGIFGEEALRNFNNIQIEIDTSSYGDYNYYLKFDSNLEYDIELVNILDEIDYWQTINMNSIYGLYLIPKNLNRDIISNITLLGNYNIKIKENYTNENKGKEILSLENYDNNNFQYTFEHSDLSTLIYFKNNRYLKEDGKGDYITFDTRYYDYTIQENKFDIPIINNSNTNSNIEIKWDDFEDKKDVSLNSFLEYIENIFNGNSIKTLFNDVYNIFRKGRIGIYIFVIIISSIIIGVIKSMK